MKNINPIKTSAWKNLQAHFDNMSDKMIKSHFKNDTYRVEKFHIRWCDFYVDFSKNNITEQTLKYFYDLADEVDLKGAINAYFSGEHINQTENRAVLHTALRSKKSEILVDGKNIIPEIKNAKSKIKKLTKEVISGEKKGYTGKALTDIVNIGIGGSDLGSDMVVEALTYYKNHLKIHFVNNVDGDHVMEVIKILNPETTLFIIVSKTFTTQETISNAQTIKLWFLEHASKDDISKHFVAVSTNLNVVSEFGISPKNIFPMWDWVGGRFSLWSAVGLTIALSIGYDNYEKLLEGANLIDEHFQMEDIDKNIPINLALISVWYNNFFGAETEAIIPYTQYLNKFASYLQQGIMESNGKSVDRNGEKVNYQTGAIIWGESGTNSQHAFFQLIHQGTKLIPTDFIGFKSSLYGNKNHHDKLMSNFFAQTEALLNGKSRAQVIEELEQKNMSETQIQRLVPFKVFEGNKPTNTLLIDKLTPKSLGSLIAIYEHKIFVQGVLWNIFSYDQWGVELGKQLSSKILKDIQGETSKHDDSTKELLKQYKK